MANRHSARRAGTVPATCSCDCCCRHHHAITEIKQPDRKRSTNDDLLRIPDFAEVLGVPENVVRELVKTHRVEILKIGSRVYIPRAEAARIMRESRRPATRPLSHNRFAS